MNACDSIFKSKLIQSRIFLESLPAFLKIELNFMQLNSTYTKEVLILHLRKLFPPQTFLLNRKNTLQ